MRQNKAEDHIRFFDKNYPKRSTKRCICMNPYCQTSRIFEFQRVHMDEGIWHESHINCKNWLFEIDNLYHIFNSYSQEPIDQTQLGTDYYTSTIESIYFYKQFDSINWEDHLLYYFNQLKRMMQEQLAAIFTKTKDTIKVHLQDNWNVFQKIKHFTNQLYHYQHRTIDDLYSEYLEFDLKRMKNIGYLAMSNKELLARKAKQMLDSINEIELCLWNKELSYDLYDRVNYQNQLNELRLNLHKSSVNQINGLLQKVQSTNKVKFQFLEVEGKVTAQCFLCKKVIQSSIEPSKTRRQQCRYKFIVHLYGIHGDILYKKVAKAKPFKLTLDLLKKEIIIKNPKKLIIVDKQNVSYLNINDYMFPPDVYCLQIVSQRTQNLAKIRFISAESKGKDAADMMAVIVICEVSRFHLDQILIVTKDHFAATLKPMLSSLGTQIKISENGNELNQYKRE